MSEDSDIHDLSEEDLDKIMTVISTDGYYLQAEIVKVTSVSYTHLTLPTKA